jgi:nucleotidyltransferase substrate binding protein (TIGR01987 family)
MTRPDQTHARLAALERALRRLHAALAQPKTEWTRDAAIQRFEFTFELAWKTLMHAARAEGLECASPRQALRAALTLGWIVDDMLWLDMLEDRNRTTHTYEEATAEAIHSRLPAYADAIATLLVQLRSLTAPDAK